MSLQGRAEKFRQRMMRLADGQIDRRQAGLDAGQQLGQTHESGAPDTGFRLVLPGAIAVRHVPYSHPL
jgi:hypothetical protein